MTTLKEQQLRAKSLGYTLTQLIDVAFKLIEEKEEAEREREKMLEEMWEDRFALEGHNNRMEEWI